MSDNSARSDSNALEMRRLDLERYKAKLDFRKFVLGSVFAAITIAAIPPLFQLATAYLEYVKSEAARTMQARQFRDGYVKDFLNTALNQNIELRIRFAQYFSSVSSDKEGWTKYLADLTELRKIKKLEIDNLEQDYYKIVDQPRPNAQEVNTLNRHLEWAYAEIGYAAPNRNVIKNPRVTDDSQGPGLSLLSIPPAKRELAQKILDAFSAAGFGQFQQIAALANAIADSNLNPDAHLAGTEDSWGLFLLNRAGGLGAGFTEDELKNPDKNITIMIQAAKKSSAFSAATSLDEAVDIFVRRVSRPSNPNSEVTRQQQIARQLFRT